MKNNGTLVAFLSYVIWGFLPLYWHALDALSPAEILAHRIVWSLVMILGALALMRRWTWLGDVRRRPTAYGRYVVTAIILAVNYGVYLWANNSGHLVEASLGYFINPLINVLLGMIFLRERLRPWQAVAVLVALAGVVYLTVDYGRLPWIALTLALSFGTYGLLRKTAGLGSIEGLTLEMAVLFLPSLAYLLVLAGQGVGAFANSSPSTNLLLVGAGAATAVPMLMFTYGARRVTMTTLGILQYVAPTLQFLIGVYIFGEPFDQSRLIGFVVIWIALAIYWIEGFAMYRKRNSAQMTQMRAE
ncbi:MAG: EamA family transporter RarD [Anaerolineae bacterium]|nr:EamA family transporter RarD [Anaerolineae bacterium]